MKLPLITSLRRPVSTTITFPGGGGGFGLNVGVDTTIGGATGTGLDM